MTKTLINAVNKANILLVEDDTSLAEWICDYLQGHGYHIRVVHQGDLAVEFIQQQQPDLVLLDVMLPRKDGFEICKEVRPFYSHPIIMMTACDDEADEVLGLELGATDFIGKPVKPRVLLARIKAHLRTSQPNQPNQPITPLIFGSLQIDGQNKMVTRAGSTLDITSSEFDLLWVLASHAGQVITRQRLLKQLRGIDYDGFDRSMDISISRLRKKLGDSPAPNNNIKTIRAKGYLFSTDPWNRP